MVIKLVRNICFLLEASQRTEFVPRLQFADFDVSAPLDQRGAVFCITTGISCAVAGKEARSAVAQFYPQGEPEKCRRTLDQINGGGGGGIRTHGTVAGTAVFKTAALNRSATPPGTSATASQLRRFTSSVIF